MNEADTCDLCCKTNVKLFIESMYKFIDNYMPFMLNCYLRRLSKRLQFNQMSTIKNVSFIENPSKGLNPVLWDAVIRASQLDQINERKSYFI